MALLRNAWNNFKTQPEIWFFYGFLLTSPLSIRKVFFNYPVLGGFNEYTGIYLYLSDLFFSGMMITWLISILYNNNSYLSKNSFAFPFFQKKCSTWNILQNKRETFSVILIPLILVVWSFISIKWSNNASIALYRSFKLFEFYLLYLFLTLNCQCSTGTKLPDSLRNIFRVIISVGLINAIIGIIQVILQHSVGLFWLKESLISTDLPGVAKIVLGGAKYIRAYGLFPHPNILGGFLFLSIILTLVYRQLFHGEQSKPHCATQCAEWKNGRCKIYSTPKTFFATKTCSTPASTRGERLSTRGGWNYHGLANRHIFTLILSTQIVAGILTFSKSAILGLILTFAYMFHLRRNVPPQKESSTGNILLGRRGTSYWAGMEHSNIFPTRVLKKVLLAAITLGLIALMVRPDYYSLFIKSMTERLVYLNVSLAMVSANLLAGVGSGQFVLEMQRYSREALLAWQLQPVHNVFLLIWSELGLVGISLFSWLIWRLFHSKANVPRLPRETKMFPVEHFSFLRGGTSGLDFNIQTVFKALLIGFFVIALFDHYLWDIQQGQIMLWLGLGLLASHRYSI